MRWRRNDPGLRRGRQPHLGPSTRWGTRRTSPSTSWAGSAPSPRRPAPASSAASPWAYDAVGNALALTDPLGHTTQQSFDALNRPTVLTEAAGSSEQRVTTYGYDARGTNTSTVDPLGHTTQWTFEGRDRPKVVTEAVGSSEQRTDHDRLTTWPATLPAWSIPGAGPRRWPTTPSTARAAAPRRWALASSGP